MHVYELIEILQKMIKDGEINELAEVYYEGFVEEFVVRDHITFVEIEEGEVILKNGE